MKLLNDNIKSIAGDASFRKFYRIVLNNKSKILVHAQKDKHKNLIIYAAVNKFFKQKGIFTPDLFKYDFKSGIILIQDFGDTTFQKVLGQLC